MTYYLYEIECETDNILYIGVSADPDHRYSQHKKGKGAAATRRYGVKNFSILKSFENKELAESAERERVLELKMQGKKVFGAGFCITVKKGIAI